MTSKIIKLTPNPAGFGEAQDELEQSMFSSSLPIQHSHMAYEDDDIGLYVGVWDTTDMVEEPGAYPCDEFMVLLEGQAQVKNNATGELEQVNSGQSFVIPKGHDCQWHQQGYLRKYFVIWEHPHYAMPEKPSTDKLLIDGQDYLDTTKQFSSGKSNHSTYSERVSAHPCHEFIYVTQGTIVIYNQQQEITLVSGDAVFIPQATPCGMRASENFIADVAKLSLETHPVDNNNE